MPDENPGIAASQKSPMVGNLKPMEGILTTTALMTNHVANENISEMSLSSTCATLSRYRFLSAEQRIFRLPSW